MNTEASADSCDTDQIAHHFRLFFFQFGKFVYNDQKRGKIRKSGFLCPQVLVLLQIHDRP